MTATIILTIAANVALFFVSVSFFYHGRKQRKVAEQILKDATALQDDSRLKMDEALAKQIEIGELLAEVKAIADDIKHGRIKYVP